MKNVKLESFMSEHPIKVKEDVNLKTVAHLLLRYRINGILVVKSQNENELVGILTTTDLLKIINQALNKKKHRLTELKNIEAIPVGQIASKNICSLQKNDDVMKAVALMHRKNIHTIPIFDKDHLVGVIGKHDILNMALL